MLHDVAPDGRVLLDRTDRRIEVRGLLPGGGRPRELAWLDHSSPTGLTADGGHVVLTESGEGGGAEYGCSCREKHLFRPRLPGCAPAAAPTRAAALSSENMNPLQEDADDRPRSQGLPRAPDLTMAAPRRAVLALLAGAAWPWRALESAEAPRTPVIDALGEIHVHYPLALLDEIRASGLRGCVVTVGNPALQGASAFEDMAGEIDAYDRHVAAHPERLRRALSVADIDRAAADGAIALVYYTQNATPLEDDVSRLDRLHARGVRIVQLTYNARNLLGDGCLERTNAGLSRFGLEVVEGLNARRMLVDVSHCGEATTLAAIRHSKAPVAITHAGCKAVFDHPRNKSDEVLRALAERGGVIGIYQINPYLGPAERNTLDTYLRHVDHAVKVAGLEHVAIGSDREHRRIPDTPEEKQKLVEELSRLRPVTAATFRWPFFIAELNHPRRMETVRDALRARGYAAGAVDRILGGNMHRLMKETIG